MLIHGYPSAVTAVSYGLSIAQLYVFVNSGNGTVITGGLTPTLEFMEMFPMSNGEPFQLNTATDLFYTDNDYNKPIRDPRLYETMLVNGKQFGDHAAELWIGGRDNINDTETVSYTHLTLPTTSRV